MASFPCPRFFPLSLPGVLAWDSHLSRRPHLQNWFSFFQFPLTGRRCHFCFRDSSQSFGFYLLPYPVRASICPCTQLFTYSVTKYKHLLVSILTWICYLRNWLKFLFQRPVLGLLIQIRRNSTNPLFLFPTVVFFHDHKSVNFIFESQSIKSFSNNGIRYSLIHFLKIRTHK